jgi:hypothetical protein
MFRWGRRLSSASQSALSKILPDANHNTVENIVDCFLVNEISNLNFPLVVVDWFDIVYVMAELKSNGNDVYSLV